MAELPHGIYGEVNRLCTKGDDFADGGEFEQALSCYEAAWELLPAPPTNWSAALWILAAIGDVRFQQGDFSASRKALMTAMKFFDEALGNPFLRLRLGQCLFEMGDLREAGNWLTPAFLSEGLKLFTDEEPKYLTFIKSRLDAPPGGWPEG